MNPLTNRSLATNPGSALLGLGIVDQRTVVLAAVLAAVGVLLVAAGWFGVLPTVNADKAKTIGETGARILGAAGGAIALFALSGWPVLAVFGGIGGWFAITLKNAKRERRAGIERVDAIATWVETIRDNISGAAGLQQALRNSGAHAPEPIRNEVRDLVLRLQHEALVPSLRKFAADVAHPTSDMAVGCLILAASRSAGSLASVLANTAQAARDSAAMMRQIEAGRVASQSQAKMVGGISGAMTLYMIVSRREFVAPYDSLVGQIALTIMCAAVAGSVVMLHRLSKPEAHRRVFSGVEVNDADDFVVGSASLPVDSIEVG